MDMEHQARVALVACERDGTATAEQIAAARDLLDGECVRQAALAYRERAVVEFERRAALPGESESSRRIHTYWAARYAREACELRTLEVATVDAVYAICGVSRGAS